MINSQSAIHNQKSGGFTLIELIVVIVIVSVIAGIAAMIILQGARGYSDAAQRSNLHYQTRFSVERMAREIRLIRSQTAADITTMDPDTIMYTDILGAQMGFRLAGNAIQRTQNNGATWQQLATEVQTLTFTYFQQDGVTAATATTLWYVVIGVTAQQGAESLQVRTQVHPRNF